MARTDQAAAAQGRRALRRGQELELREDLDGVFTNSGCEDACSTADVVRCLTTYLPKVELGAAAVHLGFTCDDPLEG